MANNLHEVQRAGQAIATYCAPTSIPEALDLLVAHGHRARPIAGGSDLLLELDRGARTGIDTLIDLSRIDGLNEIRFDERAVRIGALVTHNQVVASARCRQVITPLAQACWEVGSPQLRNRATIVGNVVTASPANDTISALLALGATVELTSQRGIRSLPVDQFITGFRTTALDPDELVTALEVPVLAPNQRAVFVKLGLRRAQAISMVHVAAVVGFDEAIVTDLTFAVGSVAPVVLTLPAVTQAVVGRPLDDMTIESAAAVAAAAVSPIDDLRAPADYRRHLVATMTRRALGALAVDRLPASWPSEPPLLWGSTFDGRFPTGPSYGLTVRGDDVISATVNGSPVAAADAAAPTLLDWLRDQAGTNGVKEGCAEGECGACTVFLDGAAVMSCLVPAGRASAAEIVTVEGLAAGDRLHAVQQAFVDANAVQCGFCTPGFLMSAAKLLEEHPVPGRDQIESAFAGNLCRCTGYNAIEQAIHLAANSNDTPSPPSDSPSGASPGSAASGAGPGSATSGEGGRP